jgi:hypothetical protein
MLPFAVVGFFPERRTWFWYVALTVVGMALIWMTALLFSFLRYPAKEHAPRMLVSRRRSDQRKSEIARIAAPGTSRGVVAGPCA